MNRAGITTHAPDNILPRRDYTACGQHITKLYPGQPHRTKQRSVPLAIAKKGDSPSCRRCWVPLSTMQQFKGPFEDASDRGDTSHQRELACHPGASWRFQTGGSFAIESRGSTGTSERFDQVVVDDWLHCEMMDARSCFVTIAGLAISLKLTKSGAVVTNIEVRTEGPERGNLLRLLGNEAQADSSDGVERP